MGAQRHHWATLATDHRPIRAADDVPLPFVLAYDNVMQTLTHMLDHGRRPQWAKAIAQGRVEGVQLVFHYVADDDSSDALLEDAWAQWRNRSER